jgi:CheY-like chemotaxis protein
MTNPIGLVAADDPQARRYLAEALRRSGIRILEARSGDEALKLAERDSPDFVVTDIETPELGVVELCRRLRQLPGTTNVPIVAMSGARTQGDDAADAGCDAILPKPCSPALLVATIQRLLDKSAQSTRKQ